MTTIPIPKIDFEVLAREAEKRALEKSLLEYVKWAFEKKNKKPFVVNWHHIKMCETLEAVFEGRIQNLVINMPPRYSKTEIAVKSLIEWCLAKVRDSRFIHLSYSETLALDNSSEIREDVKSEWYQQHWPCKTKQDKDSKQKWELEGSTGGVYATGTMGSITGFGAGRFDDSGFGGAIIIDDPIKPDEAFSDEVRRKANERLNNTIISRRNNTNGARPTPIIIIMQRLHEDDMTGFCLNEGTDQKFVHLSIPAISEDGEALWPTKHSIEQLEGMKAADRRMFAGQYMQSPAPLEGNIVKRSWFKFYKKLPDKFDIQIQSWDFAVKDKATSDFTVGGCFGRVGADKYLIDLTRRKLDFPGAQKELVNFSKKHSRAHKKLIEDKANGSPILQTLKHAVSGMVAIVPMKDKVFRFNAVTPDIEAGNYYLPHPDICPWVEDYIDELCTFPNAKHDDMVDITSMALAELQKGVNAPAPTAGHGMGVIYT